MNRWKYILAFWKYVEDISSLMREYQIRVFTVEYN